MIKVNLESLVIEIFQWNKHYNVQHFVYGIENIFHIWLFTTIRPSLKHKYLNCIIKGLQMIIIPLQMSCNRNWADKHDQNLSFDQVLSIWRLVWSNITHGISIFSKINEVMQGLGVIILVIQILDIFLSVIYLSLVSRYSLHMSFTLQTKLGLWNHSG